MRRYAGYTSPTVCGDPVFQHRTAAWGRNHGRTVNSAPASDMSTTRPTRLQRAGHDDEQLTHYQLGARHADLMEAAK